MFRLYLIFLDLKKSCMLVTFDRIQSILFLSFQSLQESGSKKED